MSQGLRDFDEIEFEEDEKIILRQEVSRPRMAKLVNSVLILVGIALVGSVFVFGLLEPPSLIAGILFILGLAARLYMRAGPVEYILTDRRLIKIHTDEDVYIPPIVIEFSNVDSISRNFLRDGIKVRGEFEVRVSEEFEAELREARGEMDVNIPDSVLVYTKDISEFEEKLREQIESVEDATRLEEASAKDTGV